MIDLEGALVDLAEHLDHPAGDQLAADVRRRIATPIRVDERRRNRVRVLLALAAACLLIAIAVWKIGTEALFPIAGAPIWEFIERGGSYAAPLALALLPMRRARGREGDWGQTRIAD